MKLYHLIICFVIAVVFFCIGKNCTGKFDGIEKYETENGILRQQCDSLIVIINSLKDERNYHSEIIDSLDVVIAENMKQLTENRILYEKEKTRIEVIPDDSLYRIFQEYVGK